MPTSKLTLVRVDGFWKTIPRVFPCKSGRDLPLFCSSLSLPASIRIKLISFVLRSAMLKMSFLLEEIFNVFIRQIDYLVFFLFLVFIALTLLEVPFLIACLRLFMLQPCIFFFFFFSCTFFL